LRALRDWRDDPRTLATNGSREGLESGVGVRGGRERAKSRVGAGADSEVDRRVCFGGKVERDFGRTC
jgi:hypothetical protein